MNRTNSIQGKWAFWLKSRGKIRNFQTRRPLFDELSEKLVLFCNMLTKPSSCRRKKQQNWHRYVMSWSLRWEPGNEIDRAPLIPCHNRRSFTSRSAENVKHGGTCTMQWFSCFCLPWETHLLRQNKDTSNLAKSYMKAFQEILLQLRKPFFFSTHFPAGNSHNFSTALVIHVKRRN